MRRNSRYMGFALLISLVFLGFLVWSGFDRLVDNVVRPWGIAKAAQALKAEVHLERLEVGWGRVVLDGLRVDSPGAYLLQVERIDLSGSVSDLLRKRVRTVRIRQPILEWKESKAVGARTAVWPSSPPIQIDSWSIEEGSLLMVLGEERLLLREVAARGNLDASFSVEAAAVAGSRAGIPIAFSGKGAWEGRPELTITELFLSDRPVLQEPVTIAPGAESFGITLTLAQLNDVEAASLLSAIGRKPPWLTELRWEVKAPRLTFRSDRKGISLRVESAGGEVRREGLRWPWESLELQLAGSAGVWKIEGGAALPAQAQLRLTGTWSKKRLKGNWKVQVPDTLRLLRALEITPPAGTPSLRELEMEGDLSKSDGGLFFSAAKLDGRLAGKGLKGKVSGRLAIRQLEKGWLIQLKQLAATQIEYLSPDGLSAFTGGFLRLAGTLDLRQELAFDLSGKAGGLEALAGSWYADLSALPLDIETKGVWKPQEERIRLRAFNLDLAGLITARLQGSLSGKRLEFNGAVAAPRLDGSFQQKLRQLAGSVADLERLELAGGMGAAVEGSWSPEERKIDATVNFDRVTLAWGDSLRMTEVSGKLPLLLHRGASPPLIERFGTLTWDEVRAGLITSTKGRLRLTAGSNRWRLDEPLRLSMAGGWLEVPAFTLTLPKDGVEIQSSLKVTGIDLAAVSRALDWPEMGGRLGAEFPDVRFDGEEIRTGGEALLQVFNGEVRMRSISVRNPFSRHRTYHADIDFSGIDLHQLTRAFDFGEINGIADGFVHDLRLFGSVPSAFRAAFETREKGRRNISVKAIRNFNVLSQGGISAALSRSIYRFIDFYRYRKIGIRCSLRNDLFHLEGTAKPGTDNYLIYGGWLPPRLDVVVSTPDISFREMVSRLKRIERAAR